jgi:hypothetical protein
LQTDLHVPETAHLQAFAKEAHAASPSHPAKKRQKSRLARDDPERTALYLAALLCFFGEAPVQNVFETALAQLRDHHGFAFAIARIEQDSAFLHRRNFPHVDVTVGIDLEKNLVRLHALQLVGTISFSPIEISAVKADKPVIANPEIQDIPLQYKLLERPLLIQR